MNNEYRQERRKEIQSLIMEAEMENESDFSHEPEPMRPSKTEIYGNLLVDGLVIEGMTPVFTLFDNGGYKKVVCDLTSIEISFDDAGEFSIGNYGNIPILYELNSRIKLIHLMLEMLKVNDISELKDESGFIKVPDSIVDVWEEMECY